MILSLVRQSGSAKRQEGDRQRRGSQPAQSASVSSHVENDLSPGPDVRQTHYESDQARVGGSVSGGLAAPSRKALARGW